MDAHHPPVHARPSRAIAASRRRWKFADQASRVEGKRETRLHGASTASRAHTSATRAHNHVVALTAPRATFHADLHSPTSPRCRSSQPRPSHVRRQTTMNAALHGGRWCTTSCRRRRWRGAVPEPDRGPEVRPRRTTHDARACLQHARARICTTRAPSALRALAALWRRRSPHQRRAARVLRCAAIETVAVATAPTCSRAATAAPPLRQPRRRPVNRAAHVSRHCFVT